MIDSFSLDDSDDYDFFSLEVEFIDQDLIMFSVVDKRQRAEMHVISVCYSDLVSGISQLRRPDYGVEIPDERLAILHD